MSDVAWTVVLIGACVCAVLHLLGRPLRPSERAALRDKTPHPQGKPPTGGSGGRPKPRYCKNCGRRLRGLTSAPEIPVHADTDSRFCDSESTFALPVPKPTRFAEWGA